MGAQVTKPSSKSNPYARFIPREEVGDVTQWAFGAVGGDAEIEQTELPPAGDEVAPEPSAEEIREEAFSQGHLQGSEKTALEWQQKFDDYLAEQGATAARQLAALAAAFEAGLTAVHQRMGDEVLELACAIARQVVRRELRADTAALRPVIAEALGELVADGRPIAVRLHPDDARELGPALATEFSASSIQWIPDAEIAPGGCLVEQAGTVIDGHLEKRWQRALAPLGLEAPWLEEADHEAD